MQRLKLGDRLLVIMPDMQGHHATVLRVRYWNEVPAFETEFGTFSLGSDRLWRIDKRDRIFVDAMAVAFKLVKTTGNIINLDAYREQIKVLTPSEHLSNYTVS